MATPLLRPCDCLDRCGDDPALKMGRAAPCADRTRRAQADADAAERLHLQHAIAIDAAVRCIRFGAATEWADGVECFRIDDPTRLTQPHADVARAARFLLLSQRAMHHPTRPGLLRLVEPPTRRRTDRAGTTPGVTC